MGLVVGACSDGDETAEPSATSGPTSSALEPAPADAGSSTVVSSTTTSIAVGEVAPIVEALVPEMFEDLAICAVTPETTAGPFPSRDLLDRSDITEGYDGHPLRLGIRVVDDTCAPVAGAVVDIWHTDASGDYSSYTDDGSGKDEGEGSTFLRGVQTSDDAGVVEFQTIYPGWYPGRVVHIHATVQVPGGGSHTTQLYFDEVYTEQVFGETPYLEFGLPDTSWATDRLAGDPATDGSGIVLVPAETHLGPGTLGLVNLGIAT